MNLTQRLEETAERYQRRATIRRQAEANISRGDLAAANDSDRYLQRLQRLGADPARAMALTSGTESLLGALARTAPFESRAFIEKALPSDATAPLEPFRIGLERVLGKNDLIGVSFLVRGAQVAAAVGCVTGRDHRGFGSGFRVTSRLFLTNNHVLPTDAEAAVSQVKFNFQIGVDGRLEPSQVFDLDPATFFATDERLDFTLVALSPTSMDGRSLDMQSFVRLDPRQGKILVGECVNIIQHPNGEPKQVALRENRVVDILDDDHFIHYQTDTAPGASGALVANDQWDIVALHHSGVPNRDRSGQILTPDGTAWQQSMGEHRIHWIANEGVRTSRIVAALENCRVDRSKMVLLRELLDASEPPKADTKADVAPSVPVNVDPAAHPVILPAKPDLPAVRRGPSNRRGQWS